MTNIAYNIDNMQYMKEQPDGFFDLGIVDPPYGIGKDWEKRKKGIVFADTSYTNSKIPSQEYFDELKRVCKHWVIWGWNYYTEILGSTNYLIIWDKLSANNDKLHYSKCEIACTDLKIPCNIVHCEWDGYRMGSERGIKKIHPHQKPVNLYEWILINYAKKGWKIFDSHLGSGSSRIAAYNLGFDFVGTEIDPTYYNDQERRFKEHVSQLTIFNYEDLT